ncbi:Uncharacterised protein [uncultured archaeon]|nr:Uncharacterised protein [uncultured archaeon]
MRKLIFTLMSAVLLISFISACTPLENFMSPEATNMTIIITQDTTTDLFSMNTAGFSWDTQSIAIPDFATISIPISKILEGVNLRADLKDGESLPVFSNVQLSNEQFPIKVGKGDSSISDVALLNLLGGDFTGEISQDTNELNLLVQKAPSLTTKADGNYYFIKDGTDYTFGYDKGFGDIPSEYKNNIAKAIEDGVNSINLQTLIENNLFPSLNLDSQLSFLQQLGFTSSVDFENAVLEGTDSEVSVDLSSVEFQDGTYHIPVTITPSSGESPVTKNITVILNGIVNEGSDKTTSDIYIPSGFGIKDLINQIKGLPVGTTIQISVSDIQPSGLSNLGHTNMLKYFVINVSQEPSSDAQIDFTILKSYINDADKISLYVWGPASSSWTKLSTTFSGSTADGLSYSFYAITPHFSTFMVGEDTSSTNTVHHHIGMTTLISSPENNNASAKPEESPITLENPPAKEGLFARIGKFLTGAVTGVGNAVKQNPVMGVAALLTFFIAVVGVTITSIKFRRRARK